MWNGNAEKDRSTGIAGDRDKREREEKDEKKEKMK